MDGTTGVDGEEVVVSATVVDMVVLLVELVVLMVEIVVILVERDVVDSVEVGFGWLLEVSVGEVGPTVLCSVDV